MTAPIAGMVGDYAVTIVPPPRQPVGMGTPERMLVGVTVDPSQIEARLPLYPGAAVTRVFGYPGTGLPSWDVRKGDDRISRIFAAAGRSIRIAVTRKDWADDKSARAEFDAWLSSAPALLDDIAAATGYGVDVAQEHEADAKRRPINEWRRRQFLMAEWIAAHPRGRLVRLTPTQTLQYTMGKSASGKPKGDGDITPYYAGVGTPALDMYGDSWAKAYTNAVAFCEPLWRLRDASKLAPAAPEFGTARIASDKNGNGRAEWVQAVADEMRKGGCSSVCYWDDFGAGGTDLRLTPDPQVITPEVVAWQNVIAANAPGV